MKIKLDIWAAFEKFCDLDGVPTGEAQQALLAQYVRAREAGLSVPSLHLDEAMTAAPAPLPSALAVAAAPAPVEVAAQETATVSPESDLLAAWEETQRRIQATVPPETYYDWFSAVGVKRFDVASCAIFLTVPNRGWALSFDNDFGGRALLTSTLRAVTGLSALEVKYVERPPQPPRPAPERELDPAQALADEILGHYETSLSQDAAAPKVAEATRKALLATNRATPAQLDRLPALCGNRWPLLSVWLKGASAKHGSESMYRGRR